MDSAGRQSPSGWDGTMKSLLNEALARHQEAEAKEEREAAKPKAVDKKTGDDEEIEKIVESINVSIKIVGCGSGGSNTINRCSEAGITGAQLAAVNKDAKHLLSGHAPKKILIENAEAGLDRLRKFSDTTIVIYNDKLLELVPRLPINAAFKVADEILMQSIKGMTEIITKPGLVNLDYADLMTIMKGGGVAMIGIGETEGVKSKSLLGKEIYTGPVKTSAEVDEVR